MKWTCKDLEQLKTAYLDGKLTLQERIEVEEHLRECAACRREVEGMRAAWDLLDLYEAGEPSPDFAARTLSAVKDVEQNERRKWIRRTVSAIAATVLIAVAIFLYQGLSGTTSTQAPETPVAQGGEETIDAIIEPELLESLDLIEDLDFLLEYGEDLELAMEYDLYDMLSREESL